MSSTRPGEHEGSASNLARPSSQVISFAIAIVKSKPLELSVGEYIRLLRQHIAKGRRQEAVSTTHRHLDRSSFWRSECERTKDALEQAHNENVSLRIEIETMRGKRESLRPAASSKKRKKMDENAVSSSRSPKRLRPGIPPPEEDSSLSRSWLDDVAHFEISKAGETGDMLLRTIFHISAILKQQDIAEPTDLAAYIVRAASTVPRIVGQDVHKLIARELDLKSFASTLTATRRAINFLLVAFTRLAEVSKRQDLHGQLVYAIVQMFRCLTGDLSLLSEHEMSMTASAQLASASTKMSKSKKAKASKSVTVKENLVLGTYTAFLIQLIEMVDPKVDANNSLFEGMAYCILDKLGKRLYCTVFGRDRASTISDEIRKSNESDDVEDDDRTPSPQSLQVRQTKLEAPYLIHLLGRMMAAAPSHLGFAINNKTGKANHANAKGPAKGALAITAKECLQRTLINSVFGEDANDHNNPFMDCLRMPGNNNTLIPMPKVKETDTQEWFKEEVWRLLGWDILERELRLSDGDRV